MFGMTGGFKRGEKKERRQRRLSFFSFPHTYAVIPSETQCSEESVCDKVVFRWNARKSY